MTERLPLHPAPLAEAPPGNEKTGDLGLSGVFEGESRFLTRDGRFNSRRVGLGLAAYNPYTVLLAISWPKFFTVSLALYLLLNGVFALLYFALGPGALSEMPAALGSRLLACFFFSVQTFGTIGFGHVYPVSIAADLVVTLEAFVGLMAVALVTGMLFARFSRSTHRVLFSEHAVIAPYQGGQGLMFRMINGRRGDLTDVSVEVVLSRKDTPGQTALTSAPKRRFHTLTLERSQVTFFPLAWTVVHPITPSSPLANLSAEDFMPLEIEVMVVLRALDEISQQPVQARTSYHAREIRWGRKFTPMYLREGGLLTVDARLLNMTEPAELPSVSLTGETLKPDAVQIQ